MKRFFAILLILTMVLPLCVFANAAEENVEIKPFVFATYNSGEYDKVYTTFSLWSKSNAQHISDDDIFIYTHYKNKDDSPITCAETMKAYMDTVAEGARHLVFRPFRNAILFKLEDHIFMEKGVKIIKNWFDEFIAHYHKIGGKIDGIYVDVEYFNGYSNDISNIAKDDRYVYNRIVNNPNYKTKIRPQLEERGFKFWPKVSEETPEIYSVDVNSGEEYAQSRSIWDVVLRNHFNQYVSDAFLESLLKYYPNAVLSDYQARTTYAWHKNLENYGGYVTGGNYYTAGNINNFNTYSTRPNILFFTNRKNEPVYKRIPSYTQVQYKNNAFNMVKSELIWAKHLRESDPNHRLTITIAHYNYTDREGTYSATPYYSEMMFHSALTGAILRGYCVETEIRDSGITPQDAFTVISELMNELTRVVGAADRKALDLPYTWNDSFVLSGMYAGGKNYYRLTPDTCEGAKLEDFQVKGAKDLTFTYRGQTITFPGGKIIEDGKISKVGTCGFWIETAKDVLPVITYSANRNAEYPAFIETYESFETGAEMNFAKLNPEACWEGKKNSGASLKIADDAGNKMLAMTGTYALRLNTITQNVLAGDTYAKNQAWEIDVKVPADMAAESDIVLLNIFSDKTKELEGGFKIAGGKVYYDQNGEYVELAGVDVSKGGKFTLKRSLDFNKEGAFTSDYFVYDADHKLLGEAKNIPMAEKLTLPVAKIGMSVSKIAGNPVMLDNLKLYANGLAADFELYNAKTGMQYTDLETAKDSNTAYRLSWMNGTASEKVYSIVAAYYNGDKLVEEKVIKEIKMAPGADYVDTGIVEVPEGQSVKLFARNDSKAESEQGEDTGDNTSKGESKTMLLIIIICGAVVLIALVVVAVLIVFKKPGKKE